MRMTAEQARLAPAGSGLHLIGGTGIALGRPADGQASGVWRDVSAVLDCSLSPLIRHAPCKRSPRTAAMLCSHTEMTHLWG